MRVINARHYAALGDVPYEQMTLDGKLTFLAQQLHAIAQAIGAARTGGYADPATVARLRDLYAVVANRFAALRGEAAKADAPSAFMVKLDQFSDKAIAVGQQVGAVASAAGTGLGGVLKNLPIFLVLLLGVAGLAAAGYLKQGVPGR